MLVLAALIATSVAHACGIEGSAVRSDGSKIDNTARISTSWNDTVAFPKAGWYSLDLGAPACGKSITVYVDGNDGQRVTLPSVGNARVNFVVR